MNKGSFVSRLAAAHRAGAEQAAENGKAAGAAPHPRTVEITQWDAVTVAVVEGVNEMLSPFGIGVIERADDHGTRELAIVDLPLVAPLHTDANVEPLAPAEPEVA